MLISYSIFTKTTVARKWAFVIWMLAAGASMGAMATGEEAEEVAEEWGMSHKDIHEHEEMAEKAHLLCISLGILSLVLVIFEIRQIKAWKGSEYVMTLLALVTFAMMAWTAHEGGKLRHPELYQNPPTDQQSPEGEHMEEEHEH
jgi:uncharacterized membrane protein